jgi:hypothetical protein
MTRTLTTLAAVSLVAAAACGGAPTSPSAVGGSPNSFSGSATIGGTVVRSAAAPSAALTVAVTGTRLSSSVDSSGIFQINGVPSGDVQLTIAGSDFNSTVAVPGVADEDVIELQIAIIGDTATVQRDVRGRSPGKVVMCHRNDTGGYHAIEVNVNAEPAHRGHGDAKPWEPVPADASRIFDEGCHPIAPVSIEKFTNGQDADQAPGPSIPVGSQVTWTYVITNRSALAFSSLSVADDRGVAVACPKELPEPGASLTCTGSGQAQAGQYRNVGTVTVTINGRVYTASDPSHYLGVPVAGQ